MKQRKLKVDNPIRKAAKSLIKQKFDFRQKNLTCPHKHYHMKVQFRDLQAARPSCPLCGEAMLVKEELKEVTEGNYSIDQIIKDSDIKAYLV